MKLLKQSRCLFVAAALVALPFSGLSADERKADKSKPYPLKTCITDDEKLGSMGDPYVFMHEGREIKLCCSGCLEDFKKNPSKYIKKLEKAEKKAKK